MIILGSVFTTSETTYGANSNVEILGHKINDRPKLSWKISKNDFSMVIEINDEQNKTNILSYDIISKGFGTKLYGEPVVKYIEIGGEKYMLLVSLIRGDDGFSSGYYTYMFYGHDSNVDMVLYLPWKMKNYELTNPGIIFYGEETYSSCETCASPYQSDPEDVYVIRSSISVSLKGEVVRNIKMSNSEVNSIISRAQKYSVTRFFDWDNKSYKSLKEILK